MTEMTTFMRINQEELSQMAAAFLGSSGPKSSRGAESVSKITAGLLPPAQLKADRQTHQGPSEDLSVVRYKHYLSDNHFLFVLNFRRCSHCTPCYRDAPCNTKVPGR